jgi:hypothetical protein
VRDVRDRLSHVRAANARHASHDANVSFCLADPSRPAGLQRVLALRGRPRTPAAAPAADHDDRAGHRGDDEARREHGHEQRQDGTGDGEDVLASLTWSTAGTL